MLVRSWLELVRGFNIVHTLRMKNMHFSSSISNHWTHSFNFNEVDYFAHNMVSKALWIVVFDPTSFFDSSLLIPFTSLIFIKFFLIDCWQQLRILQFLQFFFFKLHQWSPVTIMCINSSWTSIRFNLLCTFKWYTKFCFSYTKTWWIQLWWMKHINMTRSWWKGQVSHHWSIHNNTISWRSQSCNLENV